MFKERFGNSQEVIDLHSNQMINLQPAANRTSSLRILLDTMERDIRSLEVLKQNINQDVFVSMIRATLPEEVLLKLEILNGAKNKWTADDKDDTKFKKNGQSHLEGRTRFCHSMNTRPKQTYFYRRHPASYNTIVKQESLDGAKSLTGSAEALVAYTSQSSVTRYYVNDQCRYCKQKHWSDECPKYRTISDRKG